MKKDDLNALQLWTIQPLWLYQELQRQGQLLAYPQKDPLTFMGDSDSLSAQMAYAWLARQMELRGCARPDPSAWPFWAWYQWYGEAKRKPDLRYSQLKSWAGKKRYVLLELAMPKEQVLLSDFSAWHCPLNYWYLGPDKQQRAFNAKAKRHNLSVYRQKPLPVEELHKEVEKSWEICLDLARSRRLMECTKADQVIQATFWELRLANVRSAVAFGAGQPREQLALPGR